MECSTIVLITAQSCISCSRPLNVVGRVVSLFYENYVRDLIFKIIYIVVIFLGDIFIVHEQVVDYLIQYVFQVLLTAYSEHVRKPEVSFRVRIVQPQVDRIEQYAAFDTRPELNLFQVITSFGDCCILVAYVDTVSA